MSIKNQLSMIQNQLSEAVANRKVEQFETVKLLAVTKTQSVDKIQEVLQAGITAVGENRVQEAIKKQQQIKTNIEWHLIGHLQSNKVRQAVSVFDLIHSADSKKIIAEIDKSAKNIGKCQDILLEINVAAEKSKFGIIPEDLFTYAEYCNHLNNVRLCGIMTVAPFFADAEQTRPIFRQMYQLYQSLKSANLSNTYIRYLSMGMSNDYTIAVEEGANLVRIGSGIFGARQY